MRQEKRRTIRKSDICRSTEQSVCAVMKMEADPVSETLYSVRNAREWASVNRSGARCDRDADVVRERRSSAQCDHFVWALKVKTHVPSPLSN
jgi:hypothetical protein